VLRLVAHLVLMSGFIECSLVEPTGVNVLAR
jgi:hypothetical protein